jgi:hypothetical protein
MSSDLLLIGSAPLETAEEVFRTVGAPLGDALSSVPDGEVGERRWWVHRLSYQVFNGHPELDTVRRPVPDNGVERLVPHDRSDTWQFKVKPGVLIVRFGNPGWRLGFTSDAMHSYFVFKTLRQQGVLPKHVRFQISMPLVNSVLPKERFPAPGDLEKIRAGYEHALATEIAMITSRLPHDDIALQWDCSWEITDVYGAIKDTDPEGAIERNVGQIRRLTAIVPERVRLGIHLCFGTFGGWPRFAPDTLGQAVALANAAIAQTERRVDWIHIPTLNTLEDKFYEPLRSLRLNGTRVYLGLIHSMATFEERLALAKQFLPEFGVAAYCGFGREQPSAVPGIVQDHLRALKIYRAAR